MSVERERKLDFAAVADDLRVPVEVVALQDDLSPAVEALLANVVRRLRAAWIGGPAALWPDIQPIGPLARTDLDKRVAAALREGFDGFSQLLCHLQVLLLQDEQIPTEREKTLLSIEKLVVEFRHLLGDKVPVSKLNQSFSDIPRDAE